MEATYPRQISNLQGYQTYNQVPGTTFALSQAGRESQVPPSTYQYQPPVPLSGSRARSGQFVSSQVRNQEVVKGQSRINYVPYEKKVIEYQDRTYVERVPVKKKVTQYEQRRVMESIPHEVTKTDYYAIEKRVEYHKEIVPEKRIEMVQVQRKVKKYEYVPVEKYQSNNSRQIVHYPQNVDIETAKGQSRVILGQQGVNVKVDAEFRPIDPSLIYNYSSRPESGHKPVGYVDMGEHRLLSNTPSPSYYPSANNQYNYQNSTYLQEQKGPLSPRLFVTDPSGRQELHPSGESYINNLNNIGRPDVKRPFEMLSHQKEEIQPSQDYDDYGSYAVRQKYGQSYEAEYTQNSEAGHVQHYETAYPQHYETGYPQHYETGYPQQYQVSQSYAQPQHYSNNRFDANSADWHIQS